MNEVELKPCPFCGSEGVICNRLEDVYYVECWDCNAKVESYNGIKAAVARWNACAIRRGGFTSCARIYTSATTTRRASANGSASARRSRENERD